ncbi:MAG: O-antigen ligase family protein [Hyphomonadaceae bacterium]|nr:O-antigen ligase family protein [Hyphomonadaceae bacterium]
MRQARIVRMAAPATALGAIMVGLAAGGANTSELAALLSCALLALTLLAVLAAPRRTIAQWLRAHALSTAAAAAFVLWTTATAIKGAGPADPLWRALGIADGAVSISPYRTLEGLVSFLSALSAFALASLAVRDREDRRSLGRLVVLCGLGVALYALVVHAAGAQRLMVNFGSANVAATLFGMSAIFAAAAAFRAARGRKGLAALAAPPLAAATLLLSLACLMLTASRAGILLTLIALIAFAILLLVGGRMRDRTQTPAMLPWLAAFAALLFLAGGHFALARLEHLDSSAASRAVLIETHWRAFLERPLFGHGLNTFHELNAHAATPENLPALAGMGAAHNIFVQALEETGLFGALLFALMLTPPLSRALARAVRGSVWAAAMCAAALLAFAHGLVDFSLQAPALAAYFSFCLGAFTTRTPER